MKYEIFGSSVPVVEMTMEPGESVYTQSGGMVWQSDGFRMETNARGGVLKGLGRMFSGESFVMVTYTAQRPESQIAFASTVPGSLIPVDVEQHRGMVIQKGAFLCAETTVETSVVFTKKVSAGFFGGEGIILQSLSGRGKAFLEVDGDTVVKMLAPGEVFKVDTGNVVAFDRTVSYEVETVKGLGNIFFGGEGLFLTKLTGPGQIILQTLNFAEFAGRIASVIPKSNN